MLFLNTEIPDNENQELISIICSYSFQDEILSAMSKWDEKFFLLYKDHSFIQYISDNYLLKFKLIDMNSFSAHLIMNPYFENEINVEKNINIDNLSDRKNSDLFIGAVVLDLLNDANQIELRRLKSKYKNTTIL